ncbi:MAG: ABC transporter permease [Ignavibacteriaceae bacterium]
MFKNYIKVAFRNLRKNKGYSFINITGLAVGIACCIAILLYVKNELSYDKFNKYADQIYRVHLTGRINNNELNMAVSPSPLGAALMHDLPGIVTYTRIRNFGSPVLRYRNKAFSEERFYNVDSTFFKVFTVNFLEGDPAKALNQPNDVVITESMAKKYFGNEDPMGKILNADHRRDWIVTGVIKDFPQNSHFHFDFLGSLTTYEDSRNPFWLSNNYYTYVVLKKGTDPDQFQKLLDQDVKQYIGPQLEKVAGLTLEQLKKSGSSYGFVLQPLNSIHLTSHLDYEIEANSDIDYIYIFSVIALAILLIACINFINLATARSEKRAKEVGIRKTLGSNRSQLVRQFITESVLMSMLSVFIAIIVIEVFLPLFNDISGKEMSLGIFENIYTLLLLIFLAGLIGIIAGSYPAFYLSSFQPVKVLKSENKGKQKSFLRSGLVIFQFAVTIILFIGTFIIYNQLKYIQNKNLGFDKEQIIIINKTDDIGNQIESFKKELINYPGVVSLSNSNGIPGHQNGDNATRVEGTPNDRYQDLRQIWSDYGFINTYNIKMEKGRFFSVEHPSDTSAVVINEAAVKLFGLENPVGKILIEPSPHGDEKYKIIGVTKDFNYESLHQLVRPLTFHLLAGKNFAQFISVRIKPGDYQGTINYLENTWKKFAGSEAFGYNFLDQNLSHLYIAEQRTSKIATTFSTLAIFIACLGLLGLAAFITEQRTKEIGIRKVLGASIPSLLFMLSKQFLKWVLIANIIAWPVAYYVMNNWLKDFAYRININLWVFLLSGIIALVIALLTVSSHAVKAAVANPIKSLRYE